MLLDEADFCRRVLEYYEGILILTSNEVGTFDESFNSRIQIALHYEKLALDDRRPIWESFIRRLQKVGEGGVDFDDINKHIHDVARKELNATDQERYLYCSAIRAISQKGAELRGLAVSDQDSSQVR